MMPPPFPLLYRDPRLLVLDKPAGVAISDHPADAPDVIARLRAWLRTEGGGEPRSVHRLDRDTSGVLLVALDRDLAAALIEEFRERRVTKSYLAFTAPCRDAAGCIDRPVRPDPDAPGRFLADEAQGKPARTRFRRLRAWTGAALLLVKIYTGRTHQIRVHLSDCGVPVLGDRRYGGPDRVQTLVPPGRLVTIPVPRTALHASSIGFRDPASGRWRRFRAPLPADLQELARALTGRR